MYDTIGSRVRKIRKEHKLAQKFVADMLGLHRPNYAKVENDQQNLTPKQIKIFCEFFNVSADYILDIKINNKKVYDLETIERTNRLIKEASDLLKIKK